MAIGFVLVHVAPQRDQAVYQALTRVAEVVEVHPLFGEFDLIAKVEGADVDGFGHLVNTKIRPIDGVVGTKNRPEARLGPTVRPEHPHGPRASVPFVRIAQHREVTPGKLTHPRHRQRGHERQGMNGNRPTQEGSLSGGARRFLQPRRL